MAYYDALKVGWNNPTQPPPGVAGVGLSSSMATAQKITHVNAWTVTGTVPTSFYTTGGALINCMDWGEFSALTATQQSNLLWMCACPGQLLGGSGETTHMAAGMILAYFTNHSGPTVTALTQLAQNQVQLWWGVAVTNGGAGLNGPVSQADCDAAGLV